MGETASSASSAGDLILKPWEQHGGVISLPRFDYNAPSSLLSRSHSAFLITCTISLLTLSLSLSLSLSFLPLSSPPIYLSSSSIFNLLLFVCFSPEREKSATKEAISILGKYLELSASKSVDDPDENSASKRRRTCAEDLDNSDDKSVAGNCLSSETVDTSKERNPVLSLVKLNRSGLLLFAFNKDASFDTVGVVSEVIRSLEAEGSASPQWCHRIFPIQATCSLNEKELGATVTKLVLEYVNDKRNIISLPLKFAVGYNRRGFEETEMKTPKVSSNASNSSTLLDRNSCFSIVASAVKGVVPDSAVDLKSPELSVLVELLPLTGVPNGSFLVGVSVLPRSLVSTKPRLCVKALASSVKARK